MSTALILTLGSRGDTEPFIALASEMLSTSAFSAVHIFLDPRYLPLIPENTRLIPHPLPFTVTDMGPIFRIEMIKALINAIFTRHFDLVQIQVGCLSSIVKRFVVPFLSDVIRLAHQIQPSVILATMICAIAAKTVADIRDIPFCLVNLQPNTPTSAYPYTMLATDTAINAAQRISTMHTDPHFRCENTRFLQTFEIQVDYNLNSLHDLNKLRLMAGLKEMTRDDIYHLITATSSNVYVINSYPAQLIPASPDHAETIHIVPPLAASYLPENWAPERSCPNIARFLETGEKPICITFGSMRPLLGYNATRASRQLLTALRNMNVKRVLLLQGVAEISPRSLSWIWDGDLKSWADCCVFVADETPQFAWLLPRCSVLVCHGGAGTTFAGLTAGIPVVTSPVLCDQFFWGELTTKMRLGAVAGPSLGGASVDSFMSALTVVLSDDVRERARKFGEEERRLGSGSKVAAELLGSIARRNDVRESAAD